MTPITKLGKTVWLIATCLATAAQTAGAQEIARCQNAQGHAFYAFAGAVQRKDAGWTADKISNGAFSLVKRGAELDVLYVDARGAPLSSVAEGGKVLLLRADATSAAVLVVYSQVTEIYTFFMEKDGKSRFALQQAKASPLLAKNSLMVGDCSALDTTGLE